jgi:hypothetical protein
MLLSEFKQLSEAEQYHALRLLGNMVAERQYLGFCIMLFQLDGFYIEAYYNNEMDYLQGIKAFDDMNLIEPYLQCIELPNLI